MEKISLSRKAFNLLIKSLVDVEERQVEILDSCFPHPDTARTEMDAMITNYINHMNSFFEKVVVSDDEQDNQLPFVAIGSNIVVQELEGETNYEFRLITPAEESVGDGDISIFSPIGQALLLKENNSIVEYEAPAGKFQYKVLAIRLC